MHQRGPYRILVIPVTIIALMLGTRVNATPIRIDFSGTVEEVRGVPSQDFSYGDLVNGYYIFDPATPYYSYATGFPQTLPLLVSCNGYSVSSTSYMIRQDRYNQYVSADGIYLEGYNSWGGFDENSLMMDYSHMMLNPLSNFSSNNWAVYFSATELTISEAVGQVPEPGSLQLLTMGIVLVGVGLARRRRR